MKKKFGLICLVLLMVCSFSTVNASLGTYSWEGEWDSNWGKMVITQNGSTVTGTYTHDSGKIVGTVSGNTFTGTWSESPSYAPDHDAGDMELTMASDGMSFTGKWRYGSTGSWGNWEGGKRTTPIILAPSTETPVINTIGIDLEYREIVLQIDNPMMTVNKVQQEIDPGRGTVPILHNGRTVLPIRAVVEALGGTVGWNENEKKVTINVRNTTLELWLDKNTMRSGGIEKKIDVAPTAINGRTMVPVRFIIDNIPGCLLEWNNDTRSAVIKY
ncbi:MAG TPA: hypothetical protein DEG71_07525 [Clostridiales bacterium]|nr:hypothetical protein [Clostridiales bacterium]